MKIDVVSHEQTRATTQPLEEKNFEPPALKQACDVTNLCNMSWTMVKNPVKIDVVSLEQTRATTQPLEAKNFEPTALKQECDVTNLCNMSWTMVKNPPSLIQKCFG